ncbi:hypothetical protein [Leucobacter ruminantium]|uniref:DUF4365 domain-containing protein n=1 Tax=Leucobacter ruminantium TaxID=1289170 RepID=A0A939RU87_9MICO|nr:hypothetical protein [Leucobacter ruminantium]MBO1805430.1 hypothetical protein [Leucobacter ruminantium]
MNVELLAISDLEQKIASCLNLEPYFDRNDKTPFTDGHIDIYETKSRSKGHFVGRVTAQIKGQQIPKKRRRTASFSIKRVDLEGFVRLKTTVLFLVNFVQRPRDGHGAVFLPHYVTLSPFKLRQILEDMSPKQATKAVQLKKLPTDEAGIEQVVRFAKETQLESPELGFDPDIFEKASALTVFSDEPLDFSGPIALRREETNFTLVVTTIAGGRIAIPGEFDLIPQDLEPEIVPLVFGAGGVTYSAVTRSRIDEETVELRLSDALSFTMKDPELGLRGAMSWTSQEFLADALRDLTFIMHSWENSGFEVDGQKVTFEFSKPENHEEMREYRDHLAKLSSVLLHFGADPALVALDEITPNQHEQLSNLHDVISGDKEIPERYQGGGRIRQRVGHWGMELVVLAPTDETPARIVSLFDAGLSHHFAVAQDDDPTQNGYSIITPYDILPKEELPNTLNLDLGRIVSAYTQIASYSTTLSYANHMVLSLIHASDIDERRVEAFLHAASELNDWIIGEDGEQPIHLINRWQIECRRRTLTDTEKTSVRALKLKASRGEVEDGERIALCCAILLEDRDETRFLWDALAASKRSALEGWPIGNLLQTLI